MSTATVPAPIQELKAQLTVVESQTPGANPRSRVIDEHPLALLGVLIAISMVFAASFVAALAIWLYQLRDPGYWTSPSSALFFFAAATFILIFQAA